MFYSLSILLSFILGLCSAPSLVVANELGSTSPARAIEQAKLATVGILQSDVMPTDGPDYGAPLKIRGSGIHLGEGVILTARHAVERSEGGKLVVPELIHVLSDNLRELPATRQGANAYLDVAVYKLQGDQSDWPISRVKFAEHDVTYGDNVFTVGYPMGRGPALSYGKVGNPNTFLPTIQSRLVQVDLSACRGNSGGGLLNGEGQLVGLIHAIIQTETSPAERGCSRFGFAHPGLLVKRVVNAVLAGKAPGFSVLGIHLETIKEGNRWVLGVAKATGPSRHAGFRKGDILLAIDELEITTPAQLKNYLIETTEPGQKVVIRVLRGKNQRTISVQLGQS
ncbi:MAG: serine protease [Nitrospirota bacterium]|nr:MAG: serine protease [Nitrospirota bacterium]